MIPQVREEFGAGPWVTYLLRDSLACTIMAKYKLISRAAAYKRFGGDLGGYPLPSKNRQLYRTEQSAPTWECKRVDGCPIGHRPRVVHMSDPLAGHSNERGT